jgi:hypothetical protein
MLTVFSTPKPFHGHNGIIQRNALKSWTLLHPDVEVILFGDEDGAAEVCHELRIRHEPQVRRNDNGTKYLSYIFERADEVARHNILCYVNCDIMLTSDFRAALELTSKVYNKFLMIGRRWDTDISEPWDFDSGDWSHRLRSLALREGKQNGPSWVDYFCFSRGLYKGNMPPFLIGRNGWDPWLTWYAYHCEAPLVDASRSVIAVHQNHDYAYLKQGSVPLYRDAEVKYNWNLGDGTEWRYYTVKAAQEQVVDGQLKSNKLYWLGPIQSRIVCATDWVWFSLLKITRPIRHPLGLRRT